MGEQSETERHQVNRWRVCTHVAWVVVVLVILVGMVVPAILKAWEQSNIAYCLQNMRQIELAMIQYAGDYNDKYPSYLNDADEAPQRRLARLLKVNYLNAPKVFHCRSASHAKTPNWTVFGGASITDDSVSIGQVADVYLSVAWCSYGVDPDVEHTASASRAVIADRPDPSAWGPEGRGPGSGNPNANSDNHHRKGQCVAYNDGHVKWGTSCVDDADIDPNIYSYNTSVNRSDDSWVRYGSGPGKP